MENKQITLTVDRVKLILLDMYKDFYAYYYGDKNPYDYDDFGMCSIWAVFGAFSCFIRDKHFIEKYWNEDVAPKVKDELDPDLYDEMMILFEFIERCLEGGENAPKGSEARNIDNAACTCFLEDIVTHGKQGNYAYFSQFMGERTKKFCSQDNPMLGWYD